MTYTRHDGRAVDQIRNTKITPNISPYAEGSALIEVGGTKVICTASVEDKVPMFLRNKGLGWVTAEYNMLPGSTSPRLIPSRINAIWSSTYCRKALSRAR